MKKILTTLIVAILLLPFVVKADMAVIHPYFNSNTVVGGEVEIHIPISYITDYDLKITYDAKVFETNKDLITVTESLESGNQFDVNIESGTITIKAKFKQPQTAIGMSYPEMTLKFKALKAGESTINIAGKLLYENDIRITVAEKDCGSPIEKPEEPKKPDEPEQPAKEEKRNKDLILYISLGANAVLLISLIVLALKKKNKKVEE